MKARTLLAALALLILSTGVAFAASNFQVKPREFDPAKTFLVQAQWLDGIGCPTDAKVTADGSTTTTFTDAGCPTGDPTDKHNQGLLLAKTGPTTNVASAVAQIKGVKGMTLTELGYDLRKPASALDTRGSHCGAGAPRFNVVTEDDVTHFIGCNSPPATMTATSNGWIRLRWTAAQLAGAFPPIAPTAKVKSISIVFDEGQDTGPDNFGLAVLDNIDVNGTLVGDKHSDQGKHKGEENGKGHEKDNDNEDEEDD
jgi:hypothetical protein